MSTSSILSGLIIMFQNIRIKMTIIQKFIRLIATLKTWRTKIITTPPPNLKEQRVKKQKNQAQKEGDPTVWWSIRMMKRNRTRSTRSPADCESQIQFPTSEANIYSISSPIHTHSLNLSLSLARSPSLWFAYGWCRSVMANFLAQFHTIKNSCDHLVIAGFNLILFQ